MMMELDILLKSVSVVRVERRYRTEHYGNQYGFPACAAGRFVCRRQRDAADGHAYIARR